MLNVHDNGVKDWIIDWFEKNCSINKDTIITNLEKNYFEIGWIDSFLFISLISDIESELNVEFQPDEFQDRIFSTINGLAIKIEEKRS